MFRTLTRGVSFDKKRFKADAVRFKLMKDRKIEEDKVDEDKNLKMESEDEDVEVDSAVGDSESVSSSSDKSKDSSESESEDNSDQEEEDEGGMTILGDLKSATKKKKKSSSQKKASNVAEEKRLRLKRFRKAHKIFIRGEDVPEPFEKWDSLADNFGFPKDFLAAIKSCYATPTPIQMQSIPCVLEDRELLACAPTGSGKTAAYLIPLIHLLREHRPGGHRAVIVAPTRELAKQIHREATRLSECRGLKVLVLDQSNKATRNFDAKTTSKYDIIVSTPNRLVYLINDRSIDMSSVERLIVDESDKLFEAGVNGFRDQLAVVYKACGDCKRSMFSATLAADVEKWCSLNLDNVVTVTIGQRNSATEIVEQSLVYTGTEKGKLMALKNLIGEGVSPPALMFVQTKDRAKSLYDELKKFDASLKVDLIHSERSQLQRDASISALRAGHIWFLICTEILGRGIDFKGVNLVINYDFPPSTVSYIHRIGRTGRAGRPGKAVTFFTDKDKTLLRSIATLVKRAGGDVPEYMLNLKKASRQEKRQLAKFAPKREGINPESNYDKAIRVKKEQMIAASKKRKRNAEEGETGDTKKRVKKVKEDAKDKKSKNKDQKNNKNFPKRKKELKKNKKSKKSKPDSS